MWIVVLAIILLKAEKKVGKLNAGTKVNVKEKLRGNEQRPKRKQAV